MKCVNCGEPAVRSTRGAHRYTESGLSNVTLLNVEIRSCALCGEREVVIPKIEELHRVIARALITGTARITSERVQFLRKWLGFSTTTEFALHMGVRPETVSRWESKSTGYHMPPTAERLLRLMVANQEPATPYAISLFKEKPRTRLEPLKFHAPDWARAA